MAKDKGTFPKIASETKITGFNKKKKGIDPKFSGLNFTGRQLEQLSDWIDDGTELIVTIQQKQGDLLKT